MGRIGPIGIHQLVAVELIVLGTVLVLRREPLAVAAGVAVAILLVTITLGRRHGHWLSEHVLLRWRERRRRTSGRLTATDRRVALLHDLAPDLRVSTAETADGEQVGIGVDGTGCFAVLEVTPPAIGRCAAPDVPLHLLAKAIKDAQQPGAIVSVVTQTAPAPRSIAPSAIPCDDSYRHLLASVGGGAAADQMTWVAVRLDERAIAESLVEADLDSSRRVSSLDLPTQLAGLTRRISRTLRRGGCATQILDSDGLVDSLARSVDLDPEETTSSHDREEWRSWRSASLVHASFWLRSWPSVEAIHPLLGRLALTPSTFTTVATVLEPTVDADTAVSDLRCLIRVSTESGRLEGSCAQLNEIAVEGGATLLRLDGEHAPAVYASAPTGGGAP